MTRICTKCNESLPPESFKGNHKSCSNCSGDLTKLTMDAKNFKWKVPIKECEQGHRHVPIDGKCAVCDPKLVHAQLCNACNHVVLGKRINYCSDKCQRTASIPALIDRECKHCEKQLTYGQEKFCSKECHQDYNKNIRHLLNTPII